MHLSLPSRISLRTKFIIFIGAIISASYLFILYRTSVFDESMILRNAEQQARMLYKQILLTRQWASDHNGLFILERKGVEMNPYLDLPTVKDNRGHTYYMRNPAMITRELSQYAQRDGLGHFRVTSLNPVNPLNVPDDFERKSLLSFSKNTQESFAVENSPHGRNVRFIAPLMVTESCLNCHSRHGYKFGDIRGGLSITIPINWADDLINKNTHSLIFIPIGSLICALVFYYLFARRWQISFKLTYLFCLLGYATHGLLDACTSYGTQLLWPFSTERISWNTISIVDPLFTLPLFVLVIIGLKKT